jgi:hypothetical protein
VNEQGKIEIEEVEAVAPPPKARVEEARDTFERKRDYLEGFLSQSHRTSPPVNPAARRMMRSSMRSRKSTTRKSRSTSMTSA